MTNNPRNLWKPPNVVSRGVLDGSLDAFGRVKVIIKESDGPKYARYYPGYYGAGADFTHFIGGAPQAGTPVSVVQGDGGEYFIVSIQTPAKFPTIDGDSLLIQSDDRNKINLNPKDGIYLGDSLNKLRIHPTKSIISDNFDTKLNFSEASISVEGIIRRDLNPKTTIDHRESLEAFEDDLQTICLDPSVPQRSGAALLGKDKNSNNAARNYPFVEKREIVYEFANSAGFSTDQEESLLFESVANKKTPPLYDRRSARTDVLSLGLVAPNSLMETVKGTLVDVYGNILDINRNILPAGKEKDLTFRQSAKPIDVFRRLREVERKSVAYHFEINARKAAESPDNFVSLPDINDNSNFARNRSKFSIDVDKEGQLKVNVPASSETGNISLLTRYENYSTIKASDNGGDPSELPFTGLPENKDLRKDIFLDSFAFNGGSISIVDPINLSAFAAPMDRITQKTIQHGTAYHDITNVLEAHRTAPSFQYEPVVNFLDSVFNNMPDKFVTDNIIVSGPNANAGGRSGSFSFDGSVELNFGANTVDKQSLWLDTQGGIQGIIGRDNNHISMGLSMTGDLMIQVGGSDVAFSGVQGDVVTTDPRFLGKNFAWRPGAVDIRVYDKNHEFTVVRIDDNGVQVSTPGHVSITSNQSMTLKAHTYINLEAEQILFWGTDASSTRELIRNNKSIL